MPGDLSRIFLSMRPLRCVPGQPRFYVHIQSTDRTGCCVGSNFANGLDAVAPCNRRATCTEEYYNYSRHNDGSSSVNLRELQEGTTFCSVFHPSFPLSEGTLHSRILAPSVHAAASRVESKDYRWPTLSSFARYTSISHFSTNLSPEKRERKEPFELKERFANTSLHSLFRQTPNRRVDN